MYVNKVRFPVMWMDSEELTEEEELSFRALGKRVPTNKIKGSVIIDLGSIESWHEEKGGTKVNLASGDFYIIDIDEQAFAMLYTEFTSIVVKNVEYSRITSDEEFDREEDQDNDDDYGDD